MHEFDHLPYRPCAGVMLVNHEGRIFIGQRMDDASEAWQMPQGGIDEGEDAQTAALRELHEETGVDPRFVTVVAQSKDDHRYDLPDELKGRIWGGKYRGQCQSWFLLQFNGMDSDINIATAHQEFRSWRWADPDQVQETVVPFKRALYKAILAEFAPLIPGKTNSSQA
ncbi:MAG TPA: RNA pyrophosphohydrolase [Sphingopyxis sp.]|nr:RNA pyrophosphohydrolase [Sphingopyxis sp.]